MIRKPVHSLGWMPHMFSLLCLISYDISCEHDGWATVLSSRLIRLNMHSFKNKLRGLSPRAKYIPTERPPFVGEVADRRRHVVIAAETLRPYFRFLDRSRYYFFQIPPQLYSQGWMDPVPDPLNLRKSGSAKTRTRTSESVARTSHCYTTEAVTLSFYNMMTYSYALRQTCIRNYRHLSLQSNPT
jgi:hypothetical protein